jgi:hypothetical protein
MSDTLHIHLLHCLFLRLKFTQVTKTARIKEM